MRAERRAPDGRCMARRAGNYQSSAQYLGILFLTFWILLSYLVPISLFVTMEIVKFVLARPFLARAPLRATARPPGAQSSLCRGIARPTPCATHSQARQCRAHCPRPLPDTAPDAQVQ